MKSLRVLFVIFALYVSSAHATFAPGAIAFKSLSLTLPDTRQVFVEYAEPANRALPTLLLLPGVNRAFTGGEVAPQAIARQGLGVATLNFSVQPFSIVRLPEGQRPVFYNQDLSLRDFANEVLFVAEFLKRQGARAVIPVSLSYTGAVSAQLSGFPLIVETVPMTSDAATHPMMEQYRLSLKAGEILNPIYGPAITRNLLDTVYRKEWREQTDSLTNEFKLPRSRFEDMVEGYVRLSRAAEGFTWDELPIPTQARRIFILAGEENSILLRHQIQTYFRFAQARPDTAMVVVLETSHVIPALQPVLYAQLLKQMAENQIRPGVTIFKPSTGQSSYRAAGREADTYLKNWLASLR